MEDRSRPGRAVLNVSAFGLGVGVAAVVAYLAAAAVTKAWPAAAAFFMRVLCLCEMGMMGPGAGPNGALILVGAVTVFFAGLILGAVAAIVYNRLSGA